MGSEDVEWIHVALDRVHWWGSREYVNEPTFYIKGGGFLD
jgi:hypothetical protein